jgi:hypothetical protein
MGFADFIFAGIMAYAWQRVPAHQAFEATRRMPISFDSWVLVIYDDHSRSSAEQPKTVAWFTDPEEAIQFLNECLLPLWFSPEEVAAREIAAAALLKLKPVRKLKLKDIEAWRKSFNEATRAKGQILWLGTFDDMQRGEASASELASDLEFWLEENGVEPLDLNPDEPRQQKLVVEFLIQIGA